MTKILERNEAIQNLTDPLGNKWGVQISKLYPGLFTIVPIDPNSNATLPPKNLRGHYTNTDRARAALTAHLVEMWDKSDEAAARASGKRKNPMEERATA